MSAASVAEGSFETAVAPLYLEWLHPKLGQQFLNFQDNGTNFSLVRISIVRQDCRGCGDQEGAVCRG